MTSTRQPDHARALAVIAGVLFHVAEALFITATLWDRFSWGALAGLLGVVALIDACCFVAAFAHETGL